MQTEIDMHNDDEINTIEMLTHKRFKTFCAALKKARTLKSLKPLDPYDLQQYAIKDTNETI